MKTSAIEIAEPCQVDWTKMTPADGGRFCGECKKVVKNLSAMTEREAKKLLRTASEGQLCVRFLHDKHGNVFFGADAPRPDFVPASMLSRAKRALAVAGLAAASQACDATNAASDETQRAELYQNMGGARYVPGADQVQETEDAGPDGGADATADASLTDQDGGAVDAGPSTDPN